jgi:hypothetical protein
MLTGFKLSFSEVRLGLSKLRISKDPKESVSVSQFDLKPSYYPFLYGATFPPERRSGLISAMGPLTLAIAQARETQYKEKLATGLQETIDHLPGAKQIVNCFRNKTFEQSKEVLRALTDVLTLVGDRSHRRVFFPIASWDDAEWDDAF